MQGAKNFVMKDSTFYVARKVCPVTTALMVLNIDQGFCQDGVS